MSRLIWSQPALLDVQRLYRFLAPKNLDAAKRAVKAGHAPNVLSDVLRVIREEVAGNLDRHYR